MNRIKLKFMIIMLECIVYSHLWCSKAISILLKWAEKMWFLILQPNTLCLFIKTHYIYTYMSKTRSNKNHQLFYLPCLCRVCRFSCEIHGDPIFQRFVYFLVRVGHTPYINTRTGRKTAFDFHKEIVKIVYYTFLH